MEGSSQELPGGDAVTFASLSVKFVPAVPVSVPVLWALSVSGVSGDLRTRRTPTRPPVGDNARSSVPPPCTLTPCTPLKSLVLHSDTSSLSGVLSFRVPWANSAGHRWTHK